MIISAKRALLAVGGPYYESSALVSALAVRTMPMDLCLAESPQKGI